MRALFLYTEAAPYVLACLERVAQGHGVETHLVRWPAHAEAPFAELDGHGIRTAKRDHFTDEALLAFVEKLSPDIVFASGWMDKGYLRACRAMRKRGVPTVLCSDTAWRGDARQWANVLLSRFWMRRTFSHAWVTGEAQARYVRRLGFPAGRVRTGFYTADTALFAPLGERLLAERATSWPHRFLCVARYIPTKGQQYLCDAFAELCDAGEAGDWELWLVGTGGSHAEVTRSRSGGHPRVKHLGFKQAEELPDVIARCGVSVLPSTYEPWGVVVHEHACAGLPLLLSTAVGAAERFLVETENGHRFIAGDKATLRTMMRMMVLGTDAELLAMGRRSAELGLAWGPEQWARTALDLMKDR